MEYLLEKRNMNVEQIARVADLLKTIGHPLRLEILEILEQEEPLSVSDIMARCENNVEQSLLSHHLIKMKDKGVLKCEKNGMHMMYMLKDRQILHIFDCMDKCSLIK